MPDKLERRLRRFVQEHRFTTKGPLSLAVILTRRVKEMRFPIDPDSLLTDGGGQVRGLSGGTLRSILSEHGIHKTLSKEAGRTSRGSIDNARKYVAELNALSRLKAFDLDRIEGFWIARIRDYFAAKPLRLSQRAGESVTAMVNELLLQTRAREAEETGHTITGTVLQHLVGAKIEVVAGANLQHHSAAEADTSARRAGDYEYGNIAIHVTTHVSDDLIRKCKRNAEAGMRPWIVTLPNEVPHRCSDKNSGGITA